MRADEEELKNIILMTKGAESAEGKTRRPFEHTKESRESREGVVSSVLHDDRLGAMTAWASNNTLMLRKRVAEFRRDVGVRGDKEIKERPRALLCDFDVVTTRVHRKSFDGRTN